VLAGLLLRAGRLQDDDLLGDLAVGLGRSGLIRRDEVHGEGDRRLDRAHLLAERDVAQHDLGDLLPAERGELGDVQLEDQAPPLIAVGIAE
jgi:hypothetical protein